MPPPSRPGWTEAGPIPVRSSSGLIRHDLISEDTVYYWYEGSSDYLTAPAEGGSADLAQHIPTYETVLDADPEQITGTGYDDSRGHPLHLCGGIRPRRGAGGPLLDQRGERAAHLL